MGGIGEREMKKIHYSWLVCVSCTVLLVCTMGFCNNVFPVYLPYLEREYLTGAQGSGLISIRCLFGIAGMLFVEKFYRHVSLRAGLAATCWMTAAAFGIYALADTPWMFQAGAAVSGIGYGLGSMIPVAILMRNWFYERGSTAIGLCSAGSGISTILFPPVITRLIETSGIAAGFWLQSAISAAAGVLLFVVVRDTPAEKGILPYGQQRPQAAAPESGVCRKECAAAGAFAAQCGCLLVGAVAATATGHFSAHFSVQGYSSVSVSLGISTFGAFLTVSKILCGTQFDQHGGEKTGMVFLLAALSGCTLSCFADGTSLGVMYGSLVLMGIGFSAATVGVPVWAEEFSSPGTYRGILRRFQVTYAVGSTLVSSLPGIIYDCTKSYRGAYIIMSGFLLSTILLLKIAYCLRNRQRGTNG